MKMRGLYAWSQPGKYTINPEQPDKYFNSNSALVAKSGYTDLYNIAVNWVFDYWGPINGSATNWLKLEIKGCCK